MQSSARQPKLLDRVRQAVRVRHYSRRTEDAYVHWIKTYVVFHGKVHPASTQNQALSAVLFRRVRALGGWRTVGASPF
jgi:hypothetical protein